MACPIDGVPCKNGLSHDIQLHENGRLKQCELDRSMTIGGKEYPKGAVLPFNEAGNVIFSCEHRSKRFNDGLRSGLLL